MSGSTPVWQEEPEEEAARVRSAVALAEFALTDPRVHSDQRKRLLNEAIWFVTERGSVTRKYLLRYRSEAALEIQGRMSATAAAKLLHHEHVHPRKELVARLLAPGADVAAILTGADACVVTRAEHELLTAQQNKFGWARYTAAGITVIDLATGAPLDLPGRRQEECTGAGAAAAGHPAP
ncbi:hypothetical protein [Blastococcus montanus]|uniref:hypothetical protein n=1 Tax=Blastococcus montanus TaxID=3144973 RepID=UPI0032080B34